MKRALITGVTGQDGSYLAEYLVSIGYAVYGLVRRSTREYTPLPAVQYLVGDLLDGSSIMRAINISNPDEVYNLAADSFVGSSWDQPVEQAEITGLGALRVLDAVRNHPRGEDIRVYQASTSELFSGALGEAPQSETTPFHPRSPYGSAKLFAYSTAVNYRESHGMFVSCGILFNHESPRRGSEFVTQRIVTQVAEVALGRRSKVELGNLDAARDWGYAPEYVRAMHLILQQPDPSDYVVATGETHTVREFLAEAIDFSDMTYEVPVVSDSNARPAEVHRLCGDPKKINSIGWKSVVRYSELAGIMYDAALKRLGG
jgi:GDPmannose 4,6-dehydratase